MRMAKRERIKELRTLVVRGIKCLCPRCGEGKIFQSWNVLREQCTACGCPLRVREDETWFFMYMSTAAITGIFILFMFAFTPKNFLSAKLGISTLAVLLFIVTTGPRKGLALAIDYFIDKHSEYPKNL